MKKPPAFLCVIALLFGASAMAHASATTESVEKSVASSRRVWGIDTSPLSLLAGSRNLALSVGVSDRWILELKGTDLNFLDHDVTFQRIQGTEVGLRGSYYLSGERYRSSSLVRLGLFYGDWRQSEGNIAENPKQVHGPVAEALLGYQAFLWEGLHLDMNAGVELLQHRFRSVDLFTGEYGAEDRPRQISASFVTEMNVGFAF